MPYCARCGTNVHLFSFRSFSQVTGRCNKCDTQIEQAVKRFIDAFREFATDGVLTRAEWKLLEELAARENLDLDEALYYTSPEIKKLVRKGIEIATRDNAISINEEKYFKFLLEILAVPEHLVAEVNSTIQEYKTAQEIKKGALPRVQSTLPMFPGEICHLETPADYVNTDTKTFPTRSGRLWLTSMKLLFVSPQRQFELDWRRVKTVIRDGDTLVLEASIKRGNGLYIVDRPLIAEAIMSRLIVLAQSERVPPKEDKKQEERNDKGSSRPEQQEKIRTPYDILDLPPNADVDSIRLAYRRMAKLYHPDKVASLAQEFRELAELRMKEINAAYHELLR